ncbi:MAG: FtsX-like permease family protein [Acidimicrobiales bacterium]|nr:FtsX-like permease family protein [Acidimicrobiales bacterium]
MLRLTRRSLWEHKRRLVSTIVAIVLGVAFMAGTFVLTDTLDRTFDDLFAEHNEDVDAQVQGDVIFSDPFLGDQRQLLEPGLVGEIAGVEGVTKVAPFAAAFGFGSTNRILDAEGEPIGAAQGPPTLLESWVEDPELTPYVVAEGRAPAADDEIVLNVAAAEDGELEVGDDVTVVTQLGRTIYSLVGLITFGTAESSAGAVSVELTLAEAQRIAGTGDKVQQIFAKAEDGVSQQELVDRIAPLLPPTAEVLTAEQAAAQISSDVQSGFEFFQIALQVFGGIALLVGIFVISNTFSILVAQRTRELALLRAVGASRGQVLGSVLLEAVLVGAVAAVLGLVAGMGLAKGVTALLEASGSDLPTTSLQLRPATVIISLVIGLGVTLIAAMIPAIRATRVPPLAALRDVAIDRSGASRLRIIGGVVVLLLGALNLSAAWTSDGDTDAIPTVGLGAVLVIIAAIVIGPVLAGPSVRTLGSGLPLLRGVTGRLATENAARSPKRTSATSSALLIGVALVGFITVFAASAKDSVTAEVERGFKGDFVIQSDAGALGPPSGFPSLVAEEAATVEGVDVLVGVGFGSARIRYPDEVEVTQRFVSIEPEGFEEVLSPRMVEGEVSKLTDGGIIVDDDRAEDHEVDVGDTITLTVVGGAALELEVQGISDDEQLLGNFAITRTDFAEAVPELLDIQVFGTVDDGADVDDVMAAVEEATAGTPSLEVLDRDGFIGDLADQITSFVTVIYALLVLSIIIALIGIANTLSLSINERTRELGLLRAVGMHRGQMRATIRWEAVLISVLGTLVGLALGLGLSYAMVQALEGFGLTKFVVPLGSLALITVFAALLGVLASLRPAHRASRLAILDAIATS